MCKRLIEFKYFLPYIAISYEKLLHLLFNIWELFAIAPWLSLQHINKVVGDMNPSSSRTSDHFPKDI